jgi:ABC-2 type transport system ATP-binding protein
LVENLSRSYGGGKKPLIQALDDVSFAVPPGEIVGLLGPNGAGKTTCARIVSTLLRPTSGRVTVGGFDVVARPKLVRKRCGVTFGGELGLYPRLTGRQNLQYFATMQRIPPRAADQRITVLLKKVGLDERAESRVEEYSRGMKQRLHIARALLNEPLVLVLDEPSAALDPEAALELRSLVREAASAERAVMLTTHSMHEAQALCHSLVIMIRGRIRYAGTVSGLVSSGSAVIETPVGAMPRIGDSANLPGFRRSEAGPEILTIYSTMPGEAEAILRRRVPDLGPEIRRRNPTLEEAYLDLIQGADR